MNWTVVIDVKNVEHQVLVASNSFVSLNESIFEIIPFIHNIHSNNVLSHDYPLTVPQRITSCFHNKMFQQQNASTTKSKQKLNSLLKCGFNKTQSSSSKTNGKLPISLKDWRAILLLLTALQRVRDAGSIHEDEWVSEWVNDKPVSRPASRMSESYQLLLSSDATRNFAEVTFCFDDD